MKKVTYALMMGLVCLLLFSFTESTIENSEESLPALYQNIIFDNNSGSDASGTWIAQLYINGEAFPSAELESDDMPYSVVIPGSSANVEVAFIASPPNATPSDGLKDAVIFYSISKGDGKAGVEICSKTYPFSHGNHFAKLNCDLQVEPDGN